MKNADAVRAIAAIKGEAVVVVTMTTIFAFPAADVDPRVLRCAPLMGGASSIGLGVALARPETPVFVLDGDGSLLMQLGSLATIAQARPQNFVHFVFDNGVLYEGGGRVPAAGGGMVDFVSIAQAAGYASARSFDTEAEIEAGLPVVLSGPKPALVRLKIDLPDTPLWSNDNPQGELPDWWFTMMREDALALARSLRPL
jgi:phosphonopyruvate decarboxylase